MTQEAETDNTEKEKQKRKSFEKRADKQQAKQDETVLVAEYTGQLQRIQAEFENYKKRAEKEKQEASLYAKASLIKDMLIIVDTFEIAMKAMKTNNAPRDLFEGIEMVYKQLSKLMETEGVKPIESIGKKLDPFRHEVVMQKPGEKDCIVLDEIQKGYLMHDKVIRTSKVIVSKMEAETNSETKLEGGN